MTACLRWDVLNCANTASEVNTTQHSFDTPKAICIPILLLSPSHTNIPTYTYEYSFMCACVHFFPSLHPYYLTEAWHDADTELRAVSSKEMAREPISISYNKLAAFWHSVFFPSAAHRRTDYLRKRTTHPAVVMGYDMAVAWQCVNLEPPTSVPPCQHSASMSPHNAVGRTAVEWLLDWRVVSDLIMNSGIKINSRQQWARDGYKAPMEWFALINSMQHEFWWV